MKSAWVVAVLLCVVVVSGVSAQVLTSISTITGITARQQGMGNVGVAVADDGAAWWQNPAGLASLNIPCMEGKDWANDAIGTWSDLDEITGLGLTWSGYQPSKRMGFGAGVSDIEDIGTFYGAGFGMAIGTSPFSAGISVERASFDTFGSSETCEDGRDETLFNLGLMYSLPLSECAPLRLGLVVEDITNQSDLGPFYNFGVAWYATPALLLAADVVDITDETDDGPFFNFGAEYAFGTDMAWKARAGIADTLLSDCSNLTLGVGYKFVNNWRLDASWQDLGDSDAISVSAGYSF